MRRYVADGLLREREGAVYVERTIDGRVRRGLMLELDLQQYDFGRDSTSPIRPTEGTMVERLAPRIEVRRGAELELPHVLVLIDDPAGTVIEPIGAQRDGLEKLYVTALMLDGGRVAGYAVDAARAERAVAALHALADPRSFAARYRVTAGTPPMLFAVGDGNHSLATAKAIWRDVRTRVGMAHPSRYALVEVVNIHDAALVFEPIHRLLFGVTVDLRAALSDAFGAALHWTEVASAAAMRELVGKHARRFGLIGPGAHFSVGEIDGAQSTLGLDALQPFLDRLLEGPAIAEVDYIHGDDVLERLAQESGHAGLHLPALDKSELLRRVVHKGPLPRKTFSIGEANEKRCYIEARRIVPD